MNGNAGMDTGLSTGTDEKKPYYQDGEGSPQIEGRDGRKGSVIAEGAEMYGDVATAEEYGYVDRALKSRHIQFIGESSNCGLP
jgi:amino acid transporter